MTENELLVALFKQLERCKCSTDNICDSCLDALNVIRILEK